MRAHAAGSLVSLSQAPHLRTRRAFSCARRGHVTTCDDPQLRGNSLPSSPLRPPHLANGPFPFPALLWRAQASHSPGFLSNLAYCTQFSFSLLKLYTLLPLLTS
ncbi:hypothetical protein FKM82_024395 [Ascaphus truei]